MNYTLLIIIAIIVGLGLPVQSGVNALLAKHLGNPMQAGVISFIGGLLCMIAVCLFTGHAVISMKKMSSTPWYLMTGGFFGAVLVFNAIILAPRLGAVILVCALITGQLISSLILDHHGWLGYPQHSINLFRILGIVLVVAGLILVRYF